MLRNRIALTLIAWVMPMLACSANGKAGDEAKPEKKTESKPAAAPSVKARDSLHPIVKMKTSLGEITFELDAEKAPISTLNFIRYADEGFYDGTIFHRVIPTFMIQGGGFNSDMDEKKGLHDPIRNEWKNGLKNATGTIAMARTAAADSATAQFYINVVDNGMLDQPRGGAAYAVFGKVTEGMETVEKIKSAKCVNHPKYPSNDGRPVTPEVPIVIQSVKLVSDFDGARAQGMADKSVEDAKKAAEEAKVAKEKEMEDVVKKIEDETKLKMTKTASGLRYVMLREGTGDLPKPESTVEVNYLGTLTDGTKFDSSYDRGESISFALNQVIPGWSEGVSLVKPGGKIKLVIPSNLGYGPRAMGKIPANSTLVFEIELLSVK